MKFGRNLPRNQVPEWVAAYIDYKGLKKLIKSAAESVKHGGQVDTAEFFFLLDRNLEDVDRFYNKKYSDAARRMKLLLEQYGNVVEKSLPLDGDAAEDLLAALLELRNNLRKIQWFGEVNRRGFVKVTKKLDKKIPQHVERRYIEAKVDPRPFATNTSLTALLKTANDWLSKVGEIKTFDDKSSNSSSQSLTLASAKASLSLSQETFVEFDQAVQKDDSEKLLGLMKDTGLGCDPSKEPSYQKILQALLQRSISCRSKECLSKLLTLVTSLNETDDINERNCLHRFIISTSRTKIVDGNDKSLTATLDESLNDGNYIIPAAAPALSVPSRNTKEIDYGDGTAIEDTSAALLIFMLDHMQEQHRQALCAKDSTGRIPLHYAAQFGFVSIVQVIMRRMKDWNQLQLPNSNEAHFLGDIEGRTPLHLSIAGGHVQTTKALMAAGLLAGDEDWKHSIKKHRAESGALLIFATKSNFAEGVCLIVEAGADLNYQDDQGETALHLAARYGNCDCAKLMLEGTLEQKASTEIPEKTFGWTPLITASVDGQLEMVQLLVAAGANISVADTSGWTAKEHASLRGHIKIARLLVQELEKTSEQQAASITVPPTAASLNDRKSNSNINNQIKATDPVRSFGHKYLTDKSMVLVSLGSLDHRKTVEAVNLDRIPLNEAHLTQLDTALSLVVHASGADGEPSVVDLPVQEAISVDPIVFTTKDASKVKLLFDIVPTYAGSKDKIVGRGVALLSSVKPSVGSKKISLQGDLSIPIVSSHNLEVIGTVHFSFLVITPFKHPKMSINEDQTYWKKMASTMVIGHRGLGKNMASRTSLQLGENTIQSFIAAANLGASYVEFDVQLTKDYVPVIYHDFLVSETGIDAPVHTLTLEQFLHASDGGGTSKTWSGQNRGSANTEAKGVENYERKQRSMSVGTVEDGLDLTERMKHTRDFKAKGFKGNSWGNSIKAPFTTLEEMFTRLPDSIGFNIEMKYPMLFESEEQEMDTYAVELNSFVDTVLEKVYGLGGKRNIIFSSFNPDICLLLSFKQPSIPILFLTDAGTNAAGDIRASSLQEAIRFASRWNLLGVVSAAEPLVLSPRLVKVVKESGLVCVSYGTLNNDPEKVKLQVQEGIDAVIVDSVLAIRKGLTEADQNINGSTKNGESVQGAANEQVAAGEVSGIKSNGA